MNSENDVTTKRIYVIQTLSKTGEWFDRYESIFSNEDEAQHAFACNFSDPKSVLSHRLIKRTIIEEKLTTCSPIPKQSEIKHKKSRKILCDICGKDITDGQKCAVNNLVNGGFNTLCFDCWERSCC